MEKKRLVEIIRMTKEAMVEATSRNSIDVQDLQPIVAAIIQAEAMNGIENQLRTKLR